MLSFGELVLSCVVLLEDHLKALSVGIAEDILECGFIWRPLNGAQCGNDFGYFGVWLSLADHSSALSVVVDLDILVCGFGRFRLEVTHKRSLRRSIWIFGGLPFCGDRSIALTVETLESALIWGSLKSAHCGGQFAYLGTYFRREISQ